MDFFSELVLIIYFATKEVRRHFDAFRCLDFVCDLDAPWRMLQLCCAESEYCLMFHVIRVVEEADWLDFLLTADILCDEEEFK